MLIFPDRHQDMTKWRPGQSEQKGDNDESDDRDKGIKRVTIVEIQSKCSVSFNAAQAVLAARQCRPTIGNGKTQGAKCEREQ